MTKRFNIVIKAMWIGLISMAFFAGQVLAEEGYLVQEEKHPIQLLFEEQGLTFSQQEFLPLEKIVPKERTKDFEPEKWYTFNLENPREDQGNSQLPPVQQLRIELQNIVKYTETSEQEQGSFVFELFFQDAMVARESEGMTMTFEELPYGVYSFRVRSGTVIKYDINIALEEMGFSAGGTVFIGPTAEMTPYNFEKIGELIKKGEKVIVASNKAFAEKWGIRFEKKKIMSKNAMFQQGERVELIMKALNPSTLSLPLLNIKEGSLIEKLYYPRQQGSASELIFLSRDIFKFEKNKVMDILATVISPKGNSLINTDNAHGQEEVNKEKKGIYTAFKMVIALLIISIVIMIFGENLWNFWNEKDKKGKILKGIMGKSETLRKMIYHYFYKIFATGILLLLIVGAGVLAVLKWYIKNSGLDLFPNFKIDDFLKAQETFLSDTAVPIFTMVLLGIFLFILWLQWPQIRKYKEKCVEYAKNRKEYFERHGTILTFFPLFVFACGVIFLYAWFFTSTWKYPMLFLMILVSFLAWIFHSLSIHGNIVINFTEKQRKAEIALKLFTTILPIIIIVVNVLQGYSESLSKNNSQEMVKNEEVITGANFDVQNSNASLIIDGPANKAGATIIAEDKAYRLINDFPVLLKIEKKIPFFEGQKGMLEIEARMKANGPLKIQTGRPATEYKKTTQKILYTPLVDAFPFKEKFKKYLVLSKNAIPTTLLDKMTLEDLIHATHPRNGKIGIYDNILKNTSDDEMFFFYKENPENIESEQREFQMNLQSPHFTFYAYLNGKADIRYSLTKLNKIWEGEEIEVKLIGPHGMTIIDEGYYLTRGAFGFENAPYEKKIKIQNLAEGIYQIHIRQRGREGKKDIEPLDFILNKMSINTSKLVLFGNVMSRGGDTLYFNNMTPHLSFSSFNEDETKSLDELGWKIESLEEDGWKPQDISQIPVDENKLSKISFPENGGILRAPYNFYSFSEESWFYPYQFFFLEPSAESDTIILYDYAETKKEGDFFITKTSFDYEKLIQGDNAWYLTLDDLSTSRTTSVILDALKVTFRN